MLRYDLRGLPIPALGYGTYPLKGEEAVACVVRALALGYRHLDTAQMYGNEAEVGRAIRACGLGRDDLFVTTKIDPANYSPERFIPSVKASLRALGLQSVDLLLLHWPNPQADFQRTMALLVEAQTRGQARRIGVSNFGPDLLRRAQVATDGRIAIDQVELHPLIDQSDLLATARELGVVVTAYSPLARGEVAKESIVAAVAAEVERSPSQVGLRWILQKGAAAIPMSRSEANQRANLAILDFALDVDQMRRLDTLTARGRKVVAPAAFSFDWP